MKPVSTDKRRVVWKCANWISPTNSSNVDYALVKLEIPKGTLVRWSKGEGGKCRASGAKVLAIWRVRKTREDGYRATPAPVVHSNWDMSFRYEPGKTVFPTDPFDTSDETCASGIHFFRTRHLAASYGGFKSPRSFPPMKKRITKQRSVVSKKTGKNKVA